MLLTIILTAMATTLILVIVRNLSSLERHLNHRLTPGLEVGSDEFLRNMTGLLGPQMTAGNKVDALHNGAVYFPAMIKAIQEAEQSVTMETFIFWSGKVGRQFADALIERAEVGVRVHVLVDWLGSTRMERPLLRRIRKSKVNFRYFRPPYLHDLVVFNNRTHRKILVVDGKIGFTGGAGIADSWDGNAENTTQWRDNQYRLEGPAVAQMQTAFMDNWIQVEAELLTGDRYFPPLEPVGDLQAQVFQSGPGNGNESGRIMYLIGIASARKSIIMAQSYFVPDDLSIEALVEAKRRGVDVQILIQGPTDAPYTLACTRHLLRKLLKAGIKIYQYQTARFHCKVFIVDGLWVSVGSSNFDARSFRLNDEANLNICDREFAESERRSWEIDREHSKLYTYKDWKSRPWKSRIWDAGWSLLRKQM